MVILSVGISGKTLNRLWYIQNSAHTNHSNSYAGYLFHRELIQTPSHLHAFAPSYLCELLQTYIPAQSLKTTSAGLLGGA